MEVAYRRASIGEVMDAARLVAPPRLSVARALVLLAAVIGLFAMHGLTGHGTSHWGEHVTTRAATPLAVHAQPHDPVADDAVSSTLGADLVVATDTEDGRLPAEMGLTGLCLAVVALAGLLAIRFMRTRGLPGGPLRTLPRRLAASHALLRTTHPPPDRHRLQVHRC